MFLRVEPNLPRLRRHAGGTSLSFWGLQGSVVACTISMRRYCRSRGERLGRMKNIMKNQIDHTRLTSAEWRLTEIHNSLDAWKAYESGWLEPRRYSTFRFDIRISVTCLFLGSLRISAGWERQVYPRNLSVPSSSGSFQKPDSRTSLTFDAWIYIICIRYLKWPRFAKDISKCLHTGGL